MKTAISIPDKIYREAESYAKSHRLTRSALFTEAVKTFVEKRKPAEITKKLNDVYAKESSSLDDILVKMQTASLIKETW